MKTLAVFAILFLLIPSKATGQFQQVATIDTDFTKITGIDDSTFSNTWTTMTSHRKEAETDLSPQNIYFDTTDGMLLQVNRSTSQDPLHRWVGAGVRSNSRFIGGRFVIWAKGLKVPDPHYSIWLMSPDQRAEIDVFEQLSSSKDKVAVGAWWGKTIEDKFKFTKADYTVSGIENLHKYQLDWTPDALEVLVDGKSVYSHKPSKENRPCLRTEQSFRIDICGPCSSRFDHQRFRIKRVQVFALK